MDALVKGGCRDLLSSWWWLLGSGDVAAATVGTTIGVDQIVVRAPSARAVIERDLVRLRIKTGLGGDMLLAPAVTRGARAREVCFPAGCWRDPQTGFTVHGPTSAAVPAPVTVLPFFFRCGTHPFATAVRTPLRMEPSQ
ncbi:MAG: hypothetical protein ACYC91_12435 [Solirubrobacteraceae bacterium]